MVDLEEGPQQKTRIGLQLLDFLDLVDLFAKVMADAGKGERLNQVHSLLRKDLSPAHSQDILKEGVILGVVNEICPQGEQPSFLVNGEIQHRKCDRGVGFHYLLGKSLHPFLLLYYLGGQHREDAVPFVGSVYKLPPYQQLFLECLHFDKLRGGIRRGDKF